jgi:hypothetical protein
VVNRTSFNNVRQRWIPEIDHHAPGVKRILCGACIELRDDDATLERLQEKGLKPITYEEGKELSKEIQAETYMECSAVTQQNLKELFDQAIRIGAGVFSPREKKKSGIGILGHLSEMMEQRKLEKDKQFMEFIQSSIETLDISGKELSVVPSAVVENKSLNKLNVAKNKLTAFSNISYLHNLTYLDLSFNLLTNIPGGIGELVNLTYFNVANNKLTMLSKELFLLSKLTYLNIRNNQITLLSPEVGLLPLTKFELAGNPLDSIPKETLQAETPTLMSYLRSMLLKQAYWNQLKLLFVGQEG